jgi:hypothetical protein
VNNREWNSCPSQNRCELEFFRNLLSRAVSIGFSSWLYSLLKIPSSHLLLGGAALQRCDKSPVSNDGFSR